MMKWVYDVATNNTMLDFVEDLIGKNILLYNATFIIKEPKSNACKLASRFNLLGFR